MTPDPIPHAPEGAVEVRPLPSRDELARMLDARAFEDAQHPYDSKVILETGRVQAAYKTADQLLAYFGHTQSAALTTPSGDEVAELRAEREQLLECLTIATMQRDDARAGASAAEAQRDALQAENARLREALEPIARSLTGWWDGRSWPDEQRVGIPINVSIGDIRRARAALTQHQQGNGGESHGG